MTDFNEIGIYNKYIFGNKSYLSLHIVRETYKNNKNKKNVYDIIDKNLKLKAIKNKIYQKKKKVCFNNNIIKKEDKSINNVCMLEEKATNTENLYEDKSTNTSSYIIITEKSNDKNLKEIKKFNSNDANLNNRITNF